MKISNTDKFISKYKLKAHGILNKIYSVFHSIAVSYFGDIFTGKDCIIWKEDKNKTISDFQKYIENLCQEDLIEKSQIRKIEGKIESKNEEYNQKDENKGLDHDDVLDNREDFEFKKEEENRSNSNENFQNPIKQNESKTDKPKQQFEFSKNNILHISFFAANKIIYNLTKNLSRTLKMLRENGVRINFFLNYGTLFCGYVGDQLKIDEVYTGSVLKETEKTINKLNSYYDEISLFIHEKF